MDNVTRSDAMDNEPQWCNAGAHNAHDATPIIVPDGTTFGRKVMVCQRCMKSLVDAHIAIGVPELSLHIAIGPWPTRALRSTADTPRTLVTIDAFPHEVRMLQLQGYTFERVGPSPAPSTMDDEVIEALGVTT